MGIGGERDKRQNWLYKVALSSKPAGRGRRVGTEGEIHGVSHAKARLPVYGLKRIIPRVKYG